MISNLQSPISSRERFAVVALLLLAFALRTVDLTRVPPGLHNDEVVVAKLTENVIGGRLAIFIPEDTGTEALHYYITAPFVRFFGTTVFALRMSSVFLSMISMCVSWALARRLMGPIVALVALSGFAIVFWAVEFGRVLLRVTAELSLAALAAYSFWRASSAGGRRALAWWALSGLCLGLSIDTYTSARTLPLVFIAFGGYVLIVHRSEWRGWWKGIAITMAVTALAVLPLALYFIQHPEDDQLSFFDIDRPLAELRQGNLAPVIETSLKTLGMFAFVGDPLPYYDIPGRPVFEPLGAFLLALGLLIALRRWRQPKYIFVLLWFFLSLAPGMISLPAPNYVRTLGVQVVLFAIPGITIATLLKRWHSTIIYLALGALFLGNLAWTAHDYFTVWPNIGVVRFWYQSGLKAVADDLQGNPSATPVAICVPDHLIDERDPWWNPAWRHMRYLLHRPDLSLRYYNCDDTIVFINGPARYAFPDVASASELDRFPAYTQFLAAINPGLETLPDQLGLILRADYADAPGRLQASLDRRMADIVANSVVAWAPEVSGAEKPTQLPINFHDKVELLGYKLSTSILEPGDSFELTTYWRVTGDLPPQLTQFTHMLNAEGGIVAQQDRLALTSTSLQMGDVFAQIHRLTLPGDLAEGGYSLAIGMYTPPRGARLQIKGASKLHSDRLWLRSIEVKR